MAELKPVDFDPFQAEGEDPSAAALRYELHLLEMQEQQQSASHLTAGNAAATSGAPAGLGEKLVEAVPRWLELQKQGLLQNLAAPHDAYYGNLSPEEMQERGIGLAGLLMGGGAGAGFGRAALAGELPAANELGIMAGRSAKTADIGALMARDQAARFDPRNVAAWRETGWWRGLEGLPRFEISDQPATLTGAHQALLEAGPGSELRLGDIWQHPDLYAAYPKLAEMPVRFRDKPGSLASYNPGDKIINVGRNALSARPQDLEPIIAHEVQHAVQDTEGFAMGASGEIYYDPRLVDQIVSLEMEAQELVNKRRSTGSWSAEEKGRFQQIKSAVDNYTSFVNKFAQPGYRASAGENEANTVMNRLGLSEAARRLVPPWKGAVPLELQDVVPQWTPEGFTRGPTEFGPARPIEGGGSSNPLINPPAQAMQEERIQSAASRMGNRIYVGPTHVESAGQVAREMGIPFDEFVDLSSNIHGFENGFVTNTGRFVSRDEAFKIANRQGQTKLPENKIREEQGISSWLEDPTKLEAEHLKGGKGPAEPADVAKSTERALATPPLSAGNEPEIVKQAMEEIRGRSWSVDRSHDVPYGAGASDQRGKTYIDRRIPSKMRIGGKSVDPARFLQLHEQLEQELMSRHGLSYEKAHHYATAAERAEVEGAGIDWAKYEKIMERYLDVTESERSDKALPADLYTKPYSHSDLRKFKGPRHEH